MAESPTYKVERVVISLLAENGITAGHYDSNTDTAANISRVSVRASDPKSFLGARKATLPPIVWECAVTVMAQEKQSVAVATWDATCAAILSALNGTAPAATVTLATTLFPNGIELFPTDSGASQDTGNDTRQFTVTFRLIYQN